MLSVARFRGLAMSGKGSAPRPFSVSNEEYANRWDAIFAKKEQLDLPLPETCKHDVWTHNGKDYECLECGITSEAGPYLSR